MSVVQAWTEQISQYDREFKKWESRAQKIVKRYKDEDRMANQNATRKFNILWSNVQTVVPAVFARLPKPDVSRRYKDNDPVGRVAALILERALEYEIEHYPDYRSAMKNAVMDRFLPGRGVAWVRYEPHISASVVPDEPGDEIGPVPREGLQVTEDADEEETAEAQAEQLDYECAPVDYVHWKDFGHTIARTWEEVTAVWRHVYMKRPALVERFGEVGSKIPLDTKPEGTERRGIEAEQYEARITEIWDKASGKAIWIAKSWPDVLDERDDPLELESFFPCAKPLYATLSTDTLVPTPDFVLYQDQADSLNILCDRIDGLIRALQVKGVYNAAIPELARLFSEGANTQMIPVVNWQSFSELKGMSGAIDLVDLVPIFNALKAAYEAFDQQKQQIYDITGLSDIVRGQSEAAETATAQRIKGQYASLRLKAMQGDVAQFAAELLQIKAQIMCRFFQPQSLAKISSADQLSEADQQHVPAALQLLKSGQLNSFRIDVSVDSLVQIDEEADKVASTELVSAVGVFIKEAAQAPAEAVPFLAELLKWAFARHKVGKTMEGALDQFADQMKQAALQPKPESPDAIKARAEEQKMQFESQRSQMEMQAEQMRAQMEMQAEQARLQNEQMTAQREQQEAERTAQREDARMQMEAAMQKMELMMKAQSEEADRRLQVLLQQMKDENTLEVAQISAETTLQAAQESAAEKATEQNE